MLGSLRDGKLLRAAKFAVLPALVASQALAQEAQCPALMQDATQLVLVTAKTMSTPVARIRLFARAGAADPWHSVGKEEAAVVGRSGMAWGFPYRALAAKGEPVKVEGDKRAPAGIYKLGGSFGFTPLARQDHLVLKPGEAICVDDTNSPAYNSVASRKSIGAAVHGEDMGKVDLYRRGLFVDYPTDRAARAGSCIFVHVWRTPQRGTVGCVAMPEPQIAALQEFAAPGTSVIAILPEEGAQPLAKCLPP